MHLSIALITAIILIVVFWKNPKHLLLLTLLVTPAYQLRFAVAGIPVTILELFILATIVSWALHTPKTHIKALINEHNILFIAIIGLATSATISMIISPDLKSAAGIWKAYFIEPILFFMVMIDCIRTKKDLQLVIGTISFTVGAIAIYAGGQALNILSTPQPWGFQNRFTGPYPYPNAAGLLIAPFIPLLISASHTLTSKKESIFTSLVALAGVITLILTKTEGAIVALIGAYLIWGMIKSRKTRIISLIIGAILITLTQTNTTVNEKLLFKDWSGQVRTMMWSDTLTMLEHHPLLGVGLSAYPIVFAEYHRHPDIEIFQYPHNIILNFWSETGALGVLSIGTIILYALIFFQKNKKTKSDELYHATAISLLVLLIHGLVDVPYFKNDLAVMFWLLIAILIASPKLDNPKKTT